MITREHFVKFNEYCKTCKHEIIQETEDPCNECLTYPVNTDSRKPINYIAKVSTPIMKHN